jgi:glycosyltransferase involved in cell wall biosynthesis
MTFSLIIPTHNRAVLLTRLLGQLLAQDHIPEEIIVVDDHSTDSTAELVNSLARRHSEIIYVVNEGRYQRDAKKTGLAHASQDYIGFLDDDVLITDKDFFAKLRPQLQRDKVIQVKVILENLGKSNSPRETFIDRLSTRPYPLLEFPGINFHTGSRPRALYPLIEFGNFWHRSLRQHFITPELIKDGYGESYASALKLYRASIPIIFIPDLVIIHPGSATGGSARFAKTSLKNNFTEFHEGYFYNMVWLHKTFYPAWIALWFPYYFIKSVIGLLYNRNWRGWYKYAWQPTWRALRYGQ